MAQLSVCAEMVYTDRPFTDRVRILHDLGFGVVLWNWSNYDIPALVKTGATFSSMTGYLSGTFTDEDGAAELLRTAEESIKVAQELGCTRLNLHGTGLDPSGLPVQPVNEVTGPMWIAAAATLTKIAALGEQNGVTFMLENLNTAVDHPGVPFARAAETMALVNAVGSPGLRMNLDLYHAQIGEGNLIELVRAAVAGGLVAEVQVADVPGRCEPGTGEIYYPAIARTLTDLKYDGSIAMEAFARGDARQAVESFRHAFTS